MARSMRDDDDLYRAVVVRKVPDEPPAPYEPQYDEDGNVLPAPEPAEPVYVETITDFYGPFTAVGPARAAASRESYPNYWDRERAVKIEKWVEKAHTVWEPVD